MPGQVIAKSQLIFSWYVARQMGRQDKEIPPRLKSIIPVTVSPASPPPSGRKLAVGSKLPRHRLILAQANSLTRSRQASKTKRNFSSSQTQPLQRLILAQPHSLTSPETGKPNLSQLLQVPLEACKAPKNMCFLGSRHSHHDLTL